MRIRLQFQNDISIEEKKQIYFIDKEKMRTVELLIQQIARDFNIVTDINLSLDGYSIIPSVSTDIFDKDDIIIVSATPKKLWNHELNTPTSSRLSQPKRKQNKMILTDDENSNNEKKQFSVVNEKIELTYEPEKDNYQHNNNADGQLFLSSENRNPSTAEEVEEFISSSSYDATMLLDNDNNSKKSRKRKRHGKSTSITYVHPEQDETDGHHLLNNKEMYIWQEYPQNFVPSSDDVIKLRMYELEPMGKLPCLSPWLQAKVIMFNEVSRSVELEFLDKNEFDEGKFLELPLTMLHEYKRRVGVGDSVFLEQRSQGVQPSKILSGILIGWDKKTKKCIIKDLTTNKEEFFKMNSLKMTL